jgi:hypothetical protein
MTKQTTLFDADTRQSDDVAGQRAHVATPPLTVARDGSTSGMKTPMRIALTMIAVSVLGLPTMATGQTPLARNTVEALPRDLEIQLALSALPRHLGDQATVYVLNPKKGFEVARQGTNGFHAFVARTGDDAMQGSWRLTKYPEDILYPISFDSAGAKANMRVFFDIAEMQAKGTPPENVKRTIQERFKTNYYKSPDRAGVSYMLSPILRSYVNPDDNDTVLTANFPHVMYYAPNVSNDAVGGAMPSHEEMQYAMTHGRWRTAPHPFVIHNGPHAYMVQQLGPVERDAVNKEYKPMLDRLCKMKKVWCLPQ